MWLGVRTEASRRSRWLLSQDSSRRAGRASVATSAGSLPNRAGEQRSDTAPTSPWSKQAATAGRERSDAAQVVDVEQLLSVLRDMLALKAIRGTRDNDELKSGLKAISAAIFAQPGGSQPGATPPSTLAVSQIGKYLNRRNAATWKIIRELQAHGLYSELDNMTDGQRAELRLSRVHGIGSNYAKTFVAHGARTVEDLLNARGREFGRKIADSQKVALRHWQDMEQLVPREEIEQFRILIEAALKHADPALEMEIVGSYRRGEPISSDIDVIAWHPSYTQRGPVDTSKRSTLKPDGLMARIMQSMYASGLMRPDEILGAGESKVMALGRLPAEGSIRRQVDIRLCPMESLPFMLVGNTGDDALMKMLRAKARNKGYMLNEYGITKLEGVGRAVDGIQTEEDVFKLLGVPYLLPSQRKQVVWRKLMRNHEAEYDYGP